MRPQFGSAPKMAVFTRALSATAFATRFASASSRSPSTSMVTRCVAPSASAAMARARSAHTADGGGLETRQRPRPGAVRSAPLANSSSVSLVLVCPSTLTQLNEASAAQSGERVQVGRGDGGVGQDEREHGRHVRADHRRPLGEAGQPHLVPADRDSPRGHLDARVGRQDGVGGSVEGGGTGFEGPAGAAGCRPRCSASAGGGR